MKSSIYLFLVLTMLLGMGSCKTREKLVYFQQNNDSTEVSNANYTPVFKTDDLLSINVTGEDPEAVLPFNLPIIQGSSSSNNGYTTGIAATNGYLIDGNGMIAMPFIGSVQIAGLSRFQATELIQTRLKDYIKNPIVQIQDRKSTRLNSSHSRASRMPSSA